jgi:hypothetical protein
MTRQQRYRYEMLVRIRDFWAANLDRFPKSSNGGRLFALVVAAVAAIEDHLTRRDRARVEARRVKATTRAAVTRYMVAIARTARRVTAGEPGLNTFKLAGSRSMAAVLAKARLFIAEARPREAAFVELGLAPTFISDFTALVDQLDQAMAVRLSGRSLRHKAQTGIETALRSGAEAVASLDVLVPNALHDDPVREGHWRGARRIEGQGPAARVAKTSVVTPVDEPPATAPVESPAPTIADSPAVEAPTPDAVAPVQPADEIERAS